MSNAAAAAASTFPRLKMKRAGHNRPARNTPKSL